jgi:type I restriction enzyme M protein
MMALPKGTDLGKALNDAMKAIEESFEPLAGVLPKEFGIFDPAVLEDLLRIFNRDALRSAGGDVFGRIYEYFLMEFAMQGAQDNGEFFTPPSIVQTIVNVIEPEHGTVRPRLRLRRNVRSVQPFHREARPGHRQARHILWQEKTATTIKLAKMNLAVHGLEGDIKEANTFYQDEHTLVGKCDFVMANPPFNVDMVDDPMAA